MSNLATKLHSGNLLSDNLMGAHPASCIMIVLGVLFYKLDKYLTYFTVFGKQF